MAEEGQELASLDFANLIGGPLNALIEAQAKSAITTANFIRQVGFDANNDVVNVKFRYEKTNDQGFTQDFELAVPFLTMVPIPYITIDEASVEFNAKITSVRESKVDSSFSQDVQHETNVGWWVRAKVNTQTSFQQKKSDTAKVERSYDMRVFVKVRNAEMPRGTERILDIMENVITQKQVSGVNKVSGLIESVTPGAAGTPTTVTLNTAEDIEAKWLLYVGATEVGPITDVTQIANKTVGVTPMDNKKAELLAAGVAFEARAPKSLKK
jgi:hypothetical protein